MITNPVVSDITIEDNKFENNLNDFELIRLNNLQTSDKILLGESDSNNFINTTQIEFNFNNFMNHSNKSAIYN